MLLEGFIMQFAIRAHGSSICLPEGAQIILPDEVSKRQNSVDVPSSVSTVH
jgi:hypothetical protein